MEQAETEETQESYLYVYGITNNKGVKLDIQGLKDKPIEKIDFKDISALTTPYQTLHPVLEEKEAMKHADILKEIAKKTTVIPMSFGTVFKNEEILEIILSKSYNAVKATLKLIENKIELGVKVVKPQSTEISEDPTQDILKPLDELAVKSVKGDLFSDRLLLNHSFLVNKDGFSKFSAQIAKLEKKYKDLKFVYTGPWPPYSFVNINISAS